MTLSHARPGEPDLEAGPDLSLTPGADMGLDAGPELPAAGQTQAWITLVTSEERAPAALRLLREAGGDWR
ncbi:MAG: hypothetical protein RDU89_10135 [bacterium]|nr:hypothetical protein [bacterium]